jgi:hypothetical protein
VADLFDAFDDEPEIPAAEPPCAAPATHTAPRPQKPSAAEISASDSAHALNLAAPCRTAFIGAHACRVGGGHAMFTDDGERTWFCGLHAPRGFFVKDRRADQ